MSWQRVLTLNSQRQPVDGDANAVVEAVRGGADLRIGTAFRHNEHIDSTSSNDELIREVMDFRITYVIEDRWVAGIQNLRMPIALPDGFGPRESMSFFLYNQDGHQAIARPHLDGQAASQTFGPVDVDPHDDMPKYHELESFDALTNAPSSNFIYDFEDFQFFVQPIWREVYSHDEVGHVESGRVEALAEAVAAGAEAKVAIRGLCDDLTQEAGSRHEVFVHLGACYYYTKQRAFMASANPVVRTHPSIPLGYGSQSWDFGWLMPRSDGHVARWLCNPYSLKFRRDSKRYAMRWFVADG